MDHLSQEDQGIHAGLGFKYTHILQMEKKKICFRFDVQFHLPGRPEGPMSPFLPGGPPKPGGPSKPGFPGSPGWPECRKQQRFF